MDDEEEELNQADESPDENDVPPLPKLNGVGH